MPVIPIAIPKGGAGKTTTALIAALELADLGKTVTIIDGDQNAHIVGWTMLPGVPPNVTVLSAKLDTTRPDQGRRCSQPVRHCRSGRDR